MPGTTDIAQATARAPKSFVFTFNLPLNTRAALSKANPMLQPCDREAESYQAHD